MLKGEESCPWTLASISLHATHKMAAGQGRPHQHGCPLVGVAHGGSDGSGHPAPRSAASCHAVQLDARAWGARAGAARRMLLRARPFGVPAALCLLLPQVVAGFEPVSVYLAVGAASALTGLLLNKDLYCRFTECCLEERPLNATGRPGGPLCTIAGFTWAEGLLGMELMSPKADGRPPQCLCILPQVLLARPVPSHPPPCNVTFSLPCYSGCRLQLLGWTWKRSCSGSTWPPKLFSRR